MNRKLTALVMLLGLIASTSASALIIDFDGSHVPTLGADNLRTTIFSGTSMTSDGNVLSLTTANSRGVWFGQAPSVDAGWDFGTSSYLRLTMRLDNAASSDWSMYMYDQAGYFSGLTFNPAGGYNDASFPVQQGFTYHVEGASHFQAADLTADFHTFEILLSGGLSSFRFDGQYLGTGTAQQTSASQILVVGDGSGSTQTGEGRMLIDAFFADTATSLTHADWQPAPTPSGTAPEPTSLALMLTGVLLAGRTARRAKA
jgi:hypothetical protein